MAARSRPYRSSQIITSPSAANSNSHTNRRDVAAVRYMSSASRFRVVAIAGHSWGYEQSADVVVVSRDIYLLVPSSYAISSGGCIVKSGMERRGVVGSFVPIMEFSDSGGVRACGVVK